MRDLPADVDHRSGGWHEVGLTDVVAGFFFLDNFVDEVAQIVVARAAAHFTVEIVVPDGKKAGANFSVGGQADAAAGSAERLRDGRNDTDFSNAVFETVAARSFGVFMLDFNQRLVFGHASDDLFERDDFVAGPGAVFFERHEFDEANDDAFFAREHAEGDDLVFVESAEQNAVDLDRFEAHPAGGADAGENVVISVRNASDAGEAVGIDRIHGDSDAVEAGVFERLRHFGQQMSVGGDGDVERLAFGCAELREVMHEVDDASAKERFAARQADLRDAKRGEHTRHTKVVREWQFGIDRALIAGAAVDALIVAAVRDGDPEVVNTASVAVV